jgi:hypothetical protein
MTSSATLSKTPITPNKIVGIKSGAGIGVGGLGLGFGIGIGVVGGVGAGGRKGLRKSMDLIRTKSLALLATEAGNPSASSTESNGSRVAKI